MDSDSLVSVEILPPNYDIITEREGRGGRELPPTYNPEAHLPNHRDIMREENVVFDLFENIMSSSQMDSQRSSIHRSKRAKKAKKKLHHSRLQTLGRQRAESEHLSRTAPNSPLMRLTAPLSPLFSIPTSNFLKRRSLLTFRTGESSEAPSAATRSEPTSVEISRANSDLGSSDPQFYTASSSMSHRNSRNSNPEHSSEQKDSSQIDEPFYTPRMQFEELSIEDIEIPENIESNKQPSTSYSSSKTGVSFLHHILSPPRTPRLELDLKKLMTPETEAKQLDEICESDIENYQNTAKMNICIDRTNASKGSTGVQGEEGQNPINSEKHTIPQNQRLLKVMSEEFIVKEKSLSEDSAYIDDELESNLASNIVLSNKGVVDEGLCTVEYNINTDYTHVSPAITVNNQSEPDSNKDRLPVEPTNRQPLIGSSSNTSIFKEIEKIEEMINEASKFDEVLENPLHSRSKNHSMVSTKDSLKEYSQINNYNQFSDEADEDKIVDSSINSLSVQIEDSGKLYSDSLQELENYSELNSNKQNLSSFNTNSNSNSSNSSIIIADKSDLKNREKVNITPEVKTNSTDGSGKVNGKKSETTRLYIESKEKNVGDEVNSSTILDSNFELVQSPNSQKEQDFASKKSNKNQGHLAMDISDDEERINNLRNILKRSLSLPSNSKKCKKSFLLLEESPRKSKKRSHTLAENPGARGSNRRNSESKTSNNVKKSRPYSSLDATTFNTFQSPGLDEILGKGQSLRTRIRESKDFISKLMKVLLSLEALETIKKLVVIDGNPSASNDYYYFREVLSILEHIIKNNLSADRYFDCMNFYLSQDNDEDKLCLNCHQNIQKSKQSGNSTKFNLKKIGKQRFIPDKLDEEEDFEMLESAMKRSIAITSNRVRYNGKEVPLVPRKLSAAEEEEMEFSKVEKAMRRSIDMESICARYSGKNVPIIPKKLTQKEEDEFELAKIESAMRRSANLSVDKARYSGKEVSIVPKSLSAEEEHEMELNILERALNRSSSTTSDNSRFLANSISNTSNDSEFEKKMHLTRVEKEEIELERFESNMRKSLDDFNFWGREAGLRRSVDSLGTREMLLSKTVQSTKRKTSAPVTLEERVSEDNHENDTEDIDELEAALSKSMSKTVDPNRYKGKKDISIIPKKLNQDEMMELELNLFEKAIQRSSHYTVDSKRFESDNASEFSLGSTTGNCIDNVFEKGRSNSFDANYTRSDEFGSRKHLFFRKLSDKIEKKADMNALSSMIEKTMQATEYSQRFSGKSLSDIPKKLSEEELRKLEFDELDQALQRSNKATTDKHRYNGKELNIVPRKMSVEELEELEISELERALSKSTSYSSMDSRYLGKNLAIIPHPLSEEEFKNTQFEQFEQALSRSLDNTFDESRYQSTILSPPNEYDLEQLDNAFKRLSQNSTQTDRYSGKNLKLAPGRLDNPVIEKQERKNILNFALVKTLRSVFSSKPVEANSALSNKRISIFINDDLEFLATAIEKTLSITSDPTKFEANQISPLSSSFSNRDSAERESDEIEPRIRPIHGNVDSIYQEAFDSSNASIQSVDKHEFRTMLSSIRKILHLKSKINENRFSFSDNSIDMPQNEHVGSLIELNNLEARLKKSLEYSIAQRLFSEDIVQPDVESLEILPESEDESIDKYLASIEDLSCAKKYSHVPRQDIDILEEDNLSKTTSQRSSYIRTDTNEHFDPKPKSSSNHKPIQGKSKTRRKVFAGARLSWTAKAGPSGNSVGDMSQRPQNKGKKYLDFKSNSRNGSNEPPQKPKPLQVKLNGLNANPPAQQPSESVDDNDNDFKSLENAIQKSLKATSDPRRYTSQKLPSIISMDSQVLSSSDDEFNDLEKALSNSMNRTRDPTRYASDKLAAKYQGKIEANGPQYIIKKTLDEAEYSRKIKSKRNNNPFMNKGGRPQLDPSPKGIVPAVASKDRMLKVLESELYQSLRAQMTHYGKALDDCYYLGPFTTSPGQYDNDEGTGYFDNESGKGLRPAQTYPQHCAGPSSSTNDHQLSIQARRQLKLSLDECHSPLTVKVDSMKELEHNLHKSIEQNQQLEKLNTMTKPKLAKLFLDKIHSLKKNLTLNLIDEKSEVRKSEELVYSIEELETLERNIRMSADENQDFEYSSYRNSIYSLGNILEEEDHSIDGLQNPNKILIQNRVLPASVQLNSPYTPHSISSLILEMNDIEFSTIVNAIESQVEETKKDSPKHPNVPSTKLKTLKRSKPLKQTASLLGNSQLNQTGGAFSPASPVAKLNRLSLNSNSHSIAESSTRSRSSIGDASSISDNELDILDQALSRAITKTICSQRFSFTETSKQAHRKMVPLRSNSINIDHFIDDNEENLKVKMSTKIQNILDGQEIHELTEPQLQLLRDNQTNLLKAIEDPEFESKCIIEGEIRAGDTIAIFQQSDLQTEEIDSPTVPLEPTNNDTIEHDKKKVRLSTFIIRRDTLPGEQELEVLVQVAVRSRQGTLCDQ